MSKMALKNYSKFDGSLLAKLKLVLEIIWVFAKSLPIFASTFYRKWVPREGKDLRNKIVLITGAGNGLGKELALQFARLGSKVICVDIKKEDNEDTVQQIREESGEKSRAVSFICDVSDHEAVDSLRETILKEYNHIDILLNNAGIIYGNKIFTGDVNNIKRVVDVNLMASYWMTRAFIPSMKDRGEGHIVFINSMASLTPMGGGTIYCVTKFGLLGLSVSLMEDLRKDCANIKISSAHPYFINTGNWYTEKLFNVRIKPLGTKTAARHIITGIRREYTHFTVPGLETGFWLASLLRLLPVKTFHMFRDIIYSDLATFENDTAYRNIPGRVTAN